jgi:nicotinamidase-related amidase
MIARTVWIQVCVAMSLAGAAAHAADEKLAETPFTRLYPTTELNAFAVETPRVDARTNGRLKMMKHPSYPGHDGAIHGGGNRLQPIGVPVQTASSESDLDDSSVLKVKTRRRVKPDGSDGQFRVVHEVKQWDAAKTAVIVIDMWDAHHCVSAARRVDEMAPHVNRTIQAARDRGAFIIHAPSDCMGYYKDAPQRRRATDAPRVTSDVPFQWNYFNPKHEGPLAERLEKGGCSCDTPEPCSPSRIVWKKQSDAIKIHPDDAVTADGQEVFNLLAQRGIDNVVILGVHTNRCVLGRPFGIRQMAYLKKNVVLCRDLTDSYHRDPGHHFEGLDAIIAHVETYWCPTVTSDSLTGQAPFLFKQSGN